MKTVNVESAYYFYICRPGMLTPKKGALTFIFITLLIDITGLGIIIPVLPTLIQELTGGDLSNAATYGGLLTFAYAAMLFVSSPVVGGLSDRFGRRPVLLISLLGFGLNYLLMGFAPTIAWLFAGRIISGITGASFTTATAYIADVSPPEKRAQNFGLIGAAFGMGFIIGPVVGGLLGQIGSRVPFFAAAAFALINCTYGYFALPESLDESHRRKFEWKRANPVGSLIQIRKYPVILSITGALICIYIAQHATQATWTFYTMEKFGWNEAWVGYSLGFVGLMMALVQAGLIRVIIPKIGQKRAIYTGLVFYAIGFLCFAFATHGWMMFAFTILFSLGGIAGPAVQGFVSGQVPPNEQGELQGGLTSLMSLCSIFGPLLMTYLFAYFTRANAPVYFPGASFAMGSLLAVVALVIVVKALRKVH